MQSDSYPSWRWSICSRHRSLLPGLVVRVRSHGARRSAGITGSDRQLDGTKVVWDNDGARRTPVPIFAEDHTAKKVWSGVLTSLDEGGRQFNMAAIVSTDTELKFELPISAASYQGRWDDAERTTQGKWQQRGQEFGLAFRCVKALPGRSVKTVWKGTINAMLQQLEVAFVELKTGQLLFDSLSQKASGFLAKDESKPGEVIYRVPAVQGTFRGELSNDQSQIVGKWSQGLSQLDLVLKKGVAGDLVAKKPARPQTPKPPPFSYLA